MLQLIALVVGFVVPYVAIKAVTALLSSPIGDIAATVMLAGFFVFTVGSIAFWGSDGRVSRTRGALVFCAFVGALMLAQLAVLVLFNPIK